MKMLVIENDPETMDTIEVTFELGWPEILLLKTGSGEKGLSLIEKDSPKLIILDLGFKESDGFEVLKKIRKLSEMPILVLNVETDKQDIVKALALGADEYLIKPFYQMEFLARVRSMTRGLRFPEQDMEISCGSWRFDKSLTELHHGLLEFELTPVEGLILHTLMKRTGQYVNSHTLVLKASNGSSLTNDSLRVHVHHIRKKIGDDCRHPQIITNKPGRGYMFKGDECFKVQPGFNLSLDPKKVMEQFNQSRN